MTPCPVINAGAVSVRMSGCEALTFRSLFGETEVQDLDDALPVQGDVRAFQVAVDDAPLVCRFERIRDLPCRANASLTGTGPRAIWSASVSPCCPATADALRVSRPWRDDVDASQIWAVLSTQSPRFSRES